MSKDTIIAFKTPEEERTDPLTDLLRTGAQQPVFVNEVVAFMSHATLRSCSFSA